jgi:hypothetical protein
VRAAPFGQPIATHCGYHGTGHAASGHQGWYERSRLRVRRDPFQKPHQRPGRLGTNPSYVHGCASVPLAEPFTSSFIPRLKFVFRPTRTIHLRSPLSARYRQITILGFGGILTISSSISVPHSTTGSRAFLSRSASAANAAAFAASSSSLRLRSSASARAAATVAR